MEFLPLRINVFKFGSNLRNRRGPLARSKDVGTCPNQVEEMHTLTKSWRCCPERQSITFLDQSNDGKVLGPLAPDSWEDEWKLEVGKQKSIYGIKRIVRDLIGADAVHVQI